MIARKNLTAFLIDAMAAVALTGHSRAPDNAGWVGDPNADGSNFTPYVVVTPLTASPATGPFDDSSADRNFPYSITSYGVLPEQVEWQADRARAVAETLAKQIIELEDGVNYKVNQVRTDVIGGIVRVDQMDPSYYGQADQMVLWMAKQRA